MKNKWIHAFPKGISAKSKANSFIQDLVLFGFFVEDQQLYYLTHSWRNKGVHAFPKSISPKVNIIVQLEFKLTHNDVTVQHVWHEATGNP